MPALSNFTMKIGAIEFTIQDIKDLLHESVSIPYIKVLRKRNGNNKIGILIAIFTEEEESQNRLDNDLIRDLKSTINSLNITPLFNIIQLDNVEAKKIDNENWIKYLKKYNSSLIIYGYVSKRNSKSGYSIKLEAGVVHNPIPHIVSQVLSIDFASLFPRKKFIPEADDLLGFEITAKEIAFVAQYMVAVALFVSGLFGPAFNLFNALALQLNSGGHDMGRLKLKVGDRIADVSRSACYFLYDLYSLKRDKKLIRETKVYIDAFNQYKPQDVSLKNLEAMYYFIIESDADKAISVLSSFDMPVKVYNLAFLYFYINDIKNGLRVYKKAVKREVSERTKNELEVFISEAIEGNPQKKQLYFARGFLNYKARKDLRLSLEDFKNVINCCYYDEKYKEIVRLSTIYCQEIRRLID